jgi:hypothetical protein
MPDFHGPADHDPYVQWLQNHPNGYVLQFNQGSDIKLHRAACRHIGGLGAMPPNGTIWTTYRKRCSEDRAELYTMSNQQCDSCSP